MPHSSYIRAVPGSRCTAGRPGFSVEILEHSGHFYYSEEDKEQLRAALRMLVSSTQEQNSAQAQNGCE